MHKMLTQKQLAEELGVAVATIRKWKECPRIWLPQVGKKRVARYDAQQVRAWLESRAAGKEVKA